MKHILYLLIFLLISNQVIGNDVNNDAKVGVDDAITALQVASGIKSQIYLPLGFSWKGNWNSNNIHYIENDIVYYEGSSYICTLTHYSNSDRLPTNIALWQLFVQKGSDGSPGKNGEKGDQGLPPEHEWQGSSIRFKNPDGTWGDLLNLTPQINQYIQSLESQLLIQNQKIETIQSDMMMLSNNCSNNNDYLHELTNLVCQYHPISEFCNNETNITSYTNTIGMKFILIPSGVFTMGSPLDEPSRNSGETQHDVTLTNSFFMQNTEVTQGQWLSIMEENPSHFNSCGNDCPVENVSWSDVQEFITKLNNREEGFLYRLPTEAEWEYAARAGTTTPFAFGNCLSTDQANYYGNMSYDECPTGVFRNKTLPVASLSANSWGFYDMHGNVLEWCQDWYDLYPTDSVTDPVGASTGLDRVLRGGSYNRQPKNCRTAVRHRGIPTESYHDVGFRLVCTQVEQ